MVNNKSKKGFTLIELIIVIAILGVLAAILVPIAVNELKTAKIGADTAIAKQMNSALARNEAVNGKNVTMNDALNVILKAGFALDKLTPTAEGCVMCWDQQADRIAFFNDANELVYSESYEVGHELWSVAHNPNEFDELTSNYSLYLGENYPQATINPLRGLDVGNNTNISDINYVQGARTEPQNVIIRTNGGTLTVNAPLDTVRHYGTALTVNVDAVAMSSFDEYGRVLGNIKVKIGHVNLARSAKVGVVQVAPDATNNVKLTGESGATLGTLDINPTEPITIGTMTLNLDGVVCSSIVKNEVAGTPTIQGTTITPTELTTEERTNADKFSGGLGTEISPYIVSTETQVGDALNAVSGYYLIGLDITVENAHEVELQDNVHFIIEEIGSLCVKGNGIVTIKLGSSIFVNGEFNIVDNGSVNVFGELVCNGKVNVSTGGILNLGNGTMKPADNPYDESGIDNNANIVIGEFGTCSVTSGKLQVSTKVKVYGVLDLTKVNLMAGSLVPGYPGKVEIKSIGTMNMLEDLQGGAISSYSGQGNFIGDCENGATIIYAEGGSNTSNDGTYVYDGATWVKQ